MAFTVDADDGDVVAWRLTDDGAVPDRDPDYAPSIRVTGPEDRLDAVERWARGATDVLATARDRRFPRFGADERVAVLRLDAAEPRGCRALARRVREVHERRPGLTPGTLRLYDVDLAPGFRYCVTTGSDPTPNRALRTCRLGLPEPDLVADDVAALRVDGDELAPDGDEATVLADLAAVLADRDPDVLVVDSAELVPTLFERAADLGVTVQLGRRPGYERLAGANTFTSYGQVGHSPARYSVPGRAILDLSNSFLWAKSGLEGLLDLVGRSWRPLQEAGWASIGTVLTAIEVREAIERDVLVPWEKWDPEQFTDVRTLHAADRGGFTTEPEVGLHEDAVELDFASLYPEIIRQHNISPETVACDCHDRADVPELGYSICERDGFLPEVLADLLDDRADYKDVIREAEAAGDEETAAEYRRRAGALKWVLVSCFGYQGYRNAKFGRIECHQAINAVARETFLTAKDALEAAGWRVAHGIVDSLWVVPDDPDPEPVERVADRVGDAVDVPLEVDGRYDWVAFCPTRDGRRGALTRYVGKRADGDYKYRGIEVRQRSTPTFVADVQRDLIEALDRHRDPAAVCDRLRRHLGALAAGEVDPAELVIRNRVSKAPGEYTRDTLPAAALARADAEGLDRAPGRDVRYVVVDDDASGRARVRLALEEPDHYDPGYYRRLLVRAAESVVSPLGWDRERVRQHLRRTEATTLAAFE